MSVDVLGYARNQTFGLDSDGNRSSKIALLTLSPFGRWCHASDRFHFEHLNLPPEFFKPTKRRRVLRNETYRLMARIRAARHL